ncbi:MAG: cytochrome c oxidase subunit II [Gemmatimonadales bacterium]|nr:cytochrome c oxidase subunit II [Gemmatimonadales bacterium]
MPVLPFARGVSLRSPWWRRLPLLALLLLVPAVAAAQTYPQSTLIPKGDFADLVDGVFWTTMWWGLLVFVLVEGALLFVIFRYRGRPDDPEPEQVHGNTMAEILWTAIPAVILAMIAVPTVRAIFKTYEQPTGDILKVEVVGHQWWWEFRYPELGLTTANELHVPRGKAVSLKMTTTDVLHSWWSPQFAAKRDVFPNRSTTLWFSARETGNWSGQCAEFCGIQHGRMGFRVIVDEPAEYDRFIGTLRASAAPPVRADSTGLQVTKLGAQAPGVAPDPLLAEGEKLFTNKGCIGCHSLNAAKPVGIGPNLAGIGSRTYLAAGWLENTDANLARWIREPQAVKEGVLMPNLGVTEPEAKALVAYLRSHK